MLILSVLWAILFAVSILLTWIECFSSRINLKYKIIWLLFGILFFPFFPLLYSIVGKSSKKHKYLTLFVTLYSSILGVTIGIMYFNRSEILYRNFFAKMDVEKLPAVVTEKRDKYISDLFLHEYRSEDGTTGLFLDLRKIQNNRDDRSELLLLNKLLSKNSESVQMLLVRASYFRTRGHLVEFNNDLTEALRLANIQVEKNPKSCYAYKMRGEVYFALDNFEFAGNDFRIARNLCIEEGVESRHEYIRLEQINYLKQSKILNSEFPHIFR